MVGKSKVRSGWLGRSRATSKGYVDFCETLHGEIEREKADRMMNVDERSLRIVMICLDRYRLPTKVYYLVLVCIYVYVRVCVQYSCVDSIDSGRTIHEESSSSFYLLDSRRLQVRMSLELVRVRVRMRARPSSRSDAMGSNALQSAEL
jgi:hypothetical protein